VASGGALQDGSAVTVVGHFIQLPEIRISRTSPVRNSRKLRTLEASHDVGVRVTPAPQGEPLVRTFYLEAELTVEHDGGNVVHEDAQVQARES
jgi:hypothetical protein